MPEAARKPGCECQQEIGDSPCPVHDCYGADAPESVRAWATFLESVRVRGSIPMRFRLHQARDGEWMLESKMLVPDREQPHVCDACGRSSPDTWITFNNKIPHAPDDAQKRLAIRQRVLGMFQHEALESIFIGGDRAFDPHDAHWYSNLVVDWRYNV